MFKLKQLKLEESGCSKVFGEVETPVMEYLWAHGLSPVRQVCDGLATPKKLSFNTVMTIMNRLVGKGLLKKRVVDGQYQYWPCQGRRCFFETVTSKIVTALVRDPSVFSLAAFVQTLGEEPARLRELKKLLDGQNARVQK